MLWSSFPISDPSPNPRSSPRTSRSSFATPSFASAATTYQRRLHHPLLHHLLLRRLPCRLPPQQGPHPLLLSRDSRRHQQLPFPSHLVLHRHLALLPSRHRHCRRPQPNQELRHHRHEPSFCAKICHFGTAELTCEVPVDAEETEVREIASASPPRRSKTRAMRIEGTRGYIAPEVIAGGWILRRSDVFAFGVILLELLSGEEPLQYRYDRESGRLEMNLIIETTRRVIGVAEEEAEGVEERYRRVREWVD